MKEIETNLSSSTEIAIKKWNGNRVVTFRDIDEVHGRKLGTASYNFKHNKKYFQKDIDYSIITREQCNSGNSPIENIASIPPKGLTVLTESGYLMIAKSFTDDLSWEVQRKLVNGYFKQKEQKQEEPKIAKATSNTLLPPPSDWFGRYNKKMELVCAKYGINRRHFYHLMLTYIGNEFDLESARRIYTNEKGFEPKFAIDVVKFFPQLQDVASKYIDNLLED